MTNSLIIPILSLILTIIGWCIVYLFQKRRDIINKRKEIRITYLINAWRLLESASNRKDSSLNINIETAIADIQLFGTKDQIELAQKLAIEISTSKQGYSLDLLKNLRADLRKELKLEEVPDTFKFIRFEN